MPHLGMINLYPIRVTNLSESVKVSAIYRIINMVLNNPIRLTHNIKSVIVNPKTRAGL